MGTDYLQLLDRHTAEIIMSADDSALAALVDLRTGIEGPPVWQNYWDAKQAKSSGFEIVTRAAQRLQTILDCGSTIEEIKDQLLNDLCIGGAWLYLDYWGCWAEAFSGEVPHGAIAWEDFTRPIRPNEGTAVEYRGDNSGCYLLTPENTDSILKSLEVHREDWRIMNDSDFVRLRAWKNFCHANPGICILYQIDM
jgi:hypothetical protein